MKLLPSDPDIQTIIARIKNGDLDLQPNFQRGEVWSDSKKRRLIDSILRDWHVPPIHVIETAHKLQEVLDGQQRLVAIRDFVDGLIRVDGRIPPYDRDIEAAAGCNYQTLPATLRRQFDQFTIRVFRLVDYKPEEPGELFYRLNQPTSLTAAEQRNAFFGPVRGQIKALAERLPDYGLSESFIGFSNSRMAYDDILAKLCISLERGTLREKLSASAITERYRNDKPLSAMDVHRVEAALHMLGEVSKTNAQPKFNKATFFSWICFCLRLLAEPAQKSSRSSLSSFLRWFEAERLMRGIGILDDDAPGQISDLIQVYNDRASARVADVFSVIARDVILIVLYGYFLERNGSSLEGKQLRSAYEALGNISRYSDTESAIADFVKDSKWGRLP
jgi:hypothetical protein